MYAHVTTYRLSTSSEVVADQSVAARNGEVISDQTARTLASYWHSPSEYSRNITSLSHGLPFDTEDLREEINREITDPDDQRDLLAWLDNLETLLSDD